MICYGNEQFSKVDFIISVRGLYYKVGTYINDKRTDITNITDIRDIFPSIHLVQCADIVYCIPTKEFVKFRGRPEDEKFYKGFFENGNIRRKSLIDMITVIENEYNILIKIWNKGKWKALAIQASDQEKFQY